MGEHIIQLFMRDGASNARGYSAEELREEQQRLNPLLDFSGWPVFTTEGHLSGVLISEPMLEAMRCDGNRKARRAAWAKARRAPLEKGAP